MHYPYHSNRGGNVTSQSMLTDNSPTNDKTSLFAKTKDANISANDLSTMQVSKWIILNMVDSNTLKTQAAPN